MSGSSPATLPPPHTWLPLLRRAIEEDLGPGDVTSALVVEAGRRGTARLEARQPLVACGLAVAEAVFRELDAGAAFEARCRDGDPSSPERRSPRSRETCGRSSRPSARRSISSGACAASRR